MDEDYIAGSRTSETSVDMWKTSQEKRDIILKGSERCPLSSLPSTSKMESSEEKKPGLCIVRSDSLHRLCFVRKTRDKAL